MIAIESLHVYPLKSGRALDRRSARIEPKGLAGDRRLMVVDADGRCITARAAPGLMRLHCDIEGDEIVLSAAGLPAIVIDRETLAPFTGEVSVWGDRVIALDGGDAIAAWLGEAIGRPCRLAVEGSRTERPLGIGPGGPMSFADTAPLLLTSRDSLADLNRYLHWPAEMGRFRPNVVVSGAPAYDEDGWGRLRIGEVEFEAIGACDRCVMVTLDPASGERRQDQEPLSMLGRVRRGDDGKVYFGQFLMPRGTGRIHAGDRVEVLGRKAPRAVAAPTAAPVTRLPRSEGGPRPGQGERPMRCIGIVDESPDMRSFRFVAEDGGGVDFLPGQFVTLLAQIGDRTVRRNYTISASPSRPHHIAVTIKRKKGGLVSGWLHDNLRVGDRVRMRGPNGRFHLAAAGGSGKLLMLSAGSGITPMMSMLRFIADTGIEIDVVFHHSARTADDLAFLDELRRLAREMAGRLRLSWNLTGAQDGANAPADPARVRAGRLDEAMLAEVVPDLAERTVLCCGPDGFRKAARAIHGKWRPAATMPFLEESFGAEPVDGGSEEIGAYSVAFAQSGATAAGSGAVTLLELARRNAIAIDADCEAGICGTCRCRVVSGKWRIAANSADPERSVLTAAEKDAGWVLACSTNPVGKVVVDL